MKNVSNGVCDRVDNETIAVGKSVTRCWWDIGTVWASFSGLLLGAFLGNPILFFSSGLILTAMIGWCNGR